MKTKLLLLLFAITIVLTSCNAQKLHQSDAIALRKFPDINKSAYQTTFDASKRGSILYINYDTDKIQLLAEPPADAIVSALSEFTSKLNIKDQISIEAANSYLESVTKLSTSSVSNTLMRDALYRLNEMQFNKWSLDGNYKLAFDQIIKMIEKVAELELKKEENENLKTEKEILKLQNSNIDIYLVRKTEKEGFEAILDNKIDDAILKFSEVENLYPKYHNAYELYIYLKKLKVEGKSINKENKKEIVEKYSWGMPSEIKKLFKVE
jgi:hypothetical protein